eukprot:TRINITY_DN18_c0_g1_i8.p1 TRINITY_DN18_c0_g1~~TRINITY_DN18_c0_g1_i8.p1  ORF type:complete len:120 (-),score=43.26 TRINITY_DN18_c0_g1_i8:75-434(-)
MDLIEAELNEERKKESIGVRDRAKQAANKERERTFQPRNNTEVNQPASFSQEQEFKKNVREIGQGLENLQDVVGDLKQIALDIREELQDQNLNLERLNETTSVEMTRLNSANQKTKRLI